MTELNARQMKQIEFGLRHGQRFPIGFEEIKHGAKLGSFLALAGNRGRSVVFGLETTTEEINKRLNNVSENHS